MEILSFIGIVVALVIIILGSLRGYSLILLSTIAALLIGATGGVEMFASYEVTYMGGVANMVLALFPIFLGGQMFGKMLEISGLPMSVANAVFKKLGPSSAVAAVYIATLLMSIGGINVFVIIFTMVIPGIATMAPQLSNIANLGISKSLWALILPGLGGVGGLYLIRQFYLSIPMDLIESARIDGASDIRIFFKIVLPLAKTVFLVQGLFCFMGSWNDLFWPQIVIGTSNKELWTLPVGVAYLSSSKTANSMGLSLASAIFSAFPIFILYLFTQNKIIEGVATSGVIR